MKAKLTFNLDDPEDRKAHKRCVKATDMAIALFDIQYNLYRKCVKEGKSPEYNEGILMAFEGIESILEENNINLEELID